MCCGSSHGARTAPPPAPALQSTHSTAVVAHAAATHFLGWLGMMRSAAEPPIPEGASWQSLLDVFNEESCHLGTFATRSVLGITAAAGIPCVDNEPALLYWKLGFGGEEPMPLGLGATLADRIRRADDVAGKRLGTIALVGANGCGKTRSGLELLQRHYGLLLVCDVRDHAGSDDFASVLSHVAGGSFIKGGDCIVKHGARLCILGRLLMLYWALIHRDTVSPANLLYMQLFGCQLPGLVRRLATLPEQQVVEWVGSVAEACQALEPRFPIVLDEAQRLTKIAPMVTDCDRHPDRTEIVSAFEVVMRVVARLCRRDGGPVAVVSGASFALCHADTAAVFGGAEPTLRHAVVTSFQWLTPPDVRRLLGHLFSGLPDSVVTRASELFQGRPQFVMALARVTLQALAHGDGDEIDGAGTGTAAGAPLDSSTEAGSRQRPQRGGCPATAASRNGCGMHRDLVPVSGEDCRAWA